MGSINGLRFCIFLFGRWLCVTRGRIRVEFCRGVSGFRVVVWMGFREYIWGKKGFVVLLRVGGGFDGRGFILVDV